MYFTRTFTIKGLHNHIYSSGFPNELLKSFRIALVRATCSTHHKIA